MHMDGGGNGGNGLLTFDSSKTSKRTLLGLRLVDFYCKLFILHFIGQLITDLIFLLSPAESPKLFL